MNEEETAILNENGTKSWRVAVASETKKARYFPVWFQDELCARIGEEARTKAVSAA